MVAACRGCRHATARALDGNVAQRRRCTFARLRMRGSESTRKSSSSTSAHCGDRHRLSGKRTEGPSGGQSVDAVLVGQRAQAERAAPPTTRPAATSRAPAPSAEEGVRAGVDRRLRGATDTDPRERSPPPPCPRSSRPPARSRRRARRRRDARGTHPPGTAARRSGRPRACGPSRSTDPRRRAPRRNDETPASPRGSGGGATRI